jgi:hypothetical protein
LPWRAVPVADEVRDRGHGRAERRTLKVTAVAAGLVDDRTDHRVGGDVEAGVDEAAGFVVLVFDDAACGEIEGEQGAALRVGGRALVQ